VHEGPPGPLGALPPVPPGRAGADLPAPDDVKRRLGFWLAASLMVGGAAVLGLVLGFALMLAVLSVLHDLRH
jgi:hypothetical protein